jgi:hypothetical protein
MPRALPSSSRDRAASSRIVRARVSHAPRDGMLLSAVFGIGRGTASPASPRRACLRHRGPMPTQPATGQGASLCSSRVPLLLPVGPPTTPAPVRRPITSLAKRTHSSRLSGMPPPARTDAAILCITRMPTRCAVMVFKRHAHPRKDERRSHPNLSLARRGAFSPRITHRFPTESPRGDQED